jgi:TRAP-type transport system periplasmic protein
MLIKRSLMLLAAAASACVALTGPALAQTQFRISTAAAEGDWLNKALQKFKEGIDKDLPGQFVVSVHANASLFRQGTEVPAMQRGNLEMSTMTTFEVEQQLPEYGVLAAGYAFRDYDHMRKVFDGPIGKDYAEAVGKTMGIQIIDTIYLGTRQMNLAKVRDVKTPADLAGLKLRMPPGPGWVALGKGLGVTPTPMGIPEVYLALKNGAIDGQENPLTITKVNNFHEVTQQIVMTSHLIQPVFFAIAKPIWDKMTPEQQTVFRKQAKEAASFNDTSRLAEEKEMVAFFEKAGLKVTTPDLVPFRASVRKQYEEAGLAQKWAPGLADKIADVR